jgi:hypothetical protein
VVAPFRPSEILRVLEEHGVEYVVIGGIAARIHGWPRATRDLDVTPQTTPENLVRLSAALVDLGAKLRVTGIEEGVSFTFDSRTFSSFTTMTLTTDHGSLDLAFRPDGTGGFDDLAQAAEPFDVFGLRIRVASLDDVIRSKTAANRLKDREALNSLRELQEVRSRQLRDCSASDE